jgi:hypothetical protein
MFTIIGHIVFGAIVERHEASDGDSTGRLRPSFPDRRRGRGRVSGPVHGTVRRGANRLVSIHIGAILIL